MLFFYRLSPYYFLYRVRLLLGTACLLLNLPCLFTVCLSLLLQEPVTSPQAQEAFTGFSQFSGVLLFQQAVWRHLLQVTQRQLGLKSVGLPGGAGRHLRRPHLLWGSSAQFPPALQFQRQSSLQGNIEHQHYHHKTHASLTQRWRALSPPLLERSASARSHRPAAPPRSPLRRRTPLASARGGASARGRVPAAAEGSRAPHPSAWSRGVAAAWPRQGGWPRRPRCHGRSRGLGLRRGLVAPVPSEPAASCSVFTWWDSWWVLGLGAKGDCVLDLEPD